MPGRRAFSAEFKSRLVLKVISGEQSSDVKRCWLYRKESLLSCSIQDIEDASSAQAAPKVYIAIASSDPDEMLVIFDLYAYRDPHATVDGYRVVLSLQDGRWHEKSIRPVYWVYSPPNTASTRRG